MAQQPLQRQQLAAAADEAGFRVGRQLAEAGRQGILKIRQRLLGGGGFEQLRVVLFLVQHRHKPIVEAQFTGAEDAAAEGVLFELALAGEHGVAHPLALDEGAVKSLNETARGFHQQAVAHGHHRGHAHLEQGRGHTLGGLASLGALAGIEADQRDAVVAQQRAELVAENGAMPALLQLAAVFWALEAEPAEAHARVIHAVAIEVHHVIRPLLVAGALQFGPQGGQRGGAEQVELHQAR